MMEHAVSGTGKHGPEMHDACITQQEQVGQGKGGACKYSHTNMRKHRTLHAPGPPTWLRSSHSNGRAAGTGQAVCCGELHRAHCRPQCLPRQLASQVCSARACAHKRVCVPVCVKKRVCLSNAE
eukprot:1159892-Pelagomonas_calceolata.AAC.4